MVRQEDLGSGGVSRLNNAWRWGDTRGQVRDCMSIGDSGGWRPLRT